MENWAYDEWFDAIKETYEELLDEGRGPRNALARVADEFDNLGKLENFIVDTAIGEIAISHDSVYVGRIEGITKRLCKFNPKDAESQLTLEEVKDLTIRINKVIEGLKEVEIDHNPLA